MIEIKNLRGRQILDSRGNPTVEVDLFSSEGRFTRASVPSGASTGTFEAFELRDHELAFHGKGVTKAVKNIEEEIKENICGKKFSSIEELDSMLIKLDGTSNKKRLGANAILGVSLAAAKMFALNQKQDLFRSFAISESLLLPIPLMNVLNGGAHANNGLDVQEFMIVPHVNNSFSDSLRAGTEIFHTLKKILNKKGFSTAVGDEGGFAPNLESNEQALLFLMEAIEDSGYKAGKDIFIALDVAATELFSDESYLFDGKKLKAKELIEMYESWRKKYPLISIEDGFSEDDWAAWSEYTNQSGEHIQIVGDDLFVTNTERVKKGIELNSANALLVKVNQIGTYSEAKNAVQLAQKGGMNTIMSHRSGETEDSIIADLAVAWGCQFIKTGGLCRSERIGKYNQLLRIEESLGLKQAQYQPMPYKI